jgi:hypothetical protein
MVKKLPPSPKLPCLCGTPVNTGWAPIRSKFRLGQLHIAPRADIVLSGAEIGHALALHAQCDWGNVSDEIRAENNNSWEHGCGRVLSRYCTHADIDFYILTNADQDTTSVFLAAEYEEYLPDKE